jgi:DNA primase
MPSPTTELIKSRLDVVDFLRGYMVLNPAGRNFKGLCPFHKEKSPSFMVSPDRQSWHCFGCGLGGDIFAFVMRYENIEFGDALRLLAEKAGVELKRENPAEYKYSGLLYDLNEEAKNFYKKMLAASPVAHKYLEERGLAKETIETFEIGWAPNEMEGLSMHLLNQQHSPQDLLQAGLSIKTERGMMLDRFRGRIMFPIHNHLGRVVGFTGRILPQFDKGDMGKYVNSPETPIFQKSKLMYGFWKTKDAIRETKSAVLVEGQMDFLMSWQAGVKNVIASSGTALTADHLRTLRRFADELILNFDNDVAGSDAAERAIDLAESNDFSVKVAILKGFKDAADAVKADPRNVERAVQGAIPAPEFYFQKYLPHLRSETTTAAAPDHNLFSTRDGIVHLRAILQKLRAMASPVERSFWMHELVKRTGVDEHALMEEAQKIASVSSSNLHEKKEEMPAKMDRPRQELLAEDLLVRAYAINDFSLLDDCAEFLLPFQKELLKMLRDGALRSEDPRIDEAMERIMLQSSNNPERDDARIASLKAQIKKEYYKERRRMLSRAIKNAEANGNEGELAAALAELSALPQMDDE